MLFFDGVDGSEACYGLTVMSIRVIVTFEVKPHQVESFLRLVQSVKTDLPMVAGCEGVEAYRSLDDPLVFTFVEAWCDRGAHRTHIEALVSSGEWRLVENHLAAAPRTCYLESC